MKVVKLSDIKELLERLNKVLSQLNGWNFEYIFVNDDSTDNSEKILLDLQNNYPIRIVNLSRKFGVGPGILAGFELSQGDALIYMDSDLQDPPELIFEMYNKLNSDDQLRTGVTPGYIRLSVGIEHIEDIINDLDNSIQSISIDLKMRKQFVPTIGSASSYVLSYQNAFYYPHSGHLGSISSTTFTYDTYTGASLKLNSSGGLSINALVGDVDTVIVENAGTVDQTAGEITISDFNPSAVTNNLLKVDVKPDSDDISSTRDYIVRVKEEDITLTISDITSVTSLTTATSSGTTTGGSTVSY